MHQTADVIEHNPYMLKAYAKKEFENKLAARSNYSFGGLTPFPEKRKGSALGASAFNFDRQGTVQVRSATGFSGASNLLGRRSLGKFGDTEKPISNMYQVVSQKEVSVPEQ